MYYCGICKSQAQRYVPLCFRCLDYVKDYVAEKLAYSSLQKRVAELERRISELEKK